MAARKVAVDVETRHLRVEKVPSYQTRTFCWSSVCSVHAPCSRAEMT